LIANTIKDGKIIVDDYRQAADILENVMSNYNYSELLSANGIRLDKEQLRKAIAEAAMTMIVKQANDFSDDILHDSLAKAIDAELK
jgi:hypothetical protein